MCSRYSYIIDPLTTSIFSDDSVLNKTVIRSNFGNHNCKIIIALQEGSILETFLVIKNLTASLATSGNFTLVFSYIKQTFGEKPTLYFFTERKDITTMFFNTVLIVLIILIIMNHFTKT
ncbi:hypothetical protein Avbf_15480 [Armadillidium vulgare]|nr:hypothetical protein Avbf_15480 [Armadillidium vulgare]